MKSKQIIICIMFIMFIMALPISFLVMRNYVDTENYENRELAGMPEISLATIAEFPKGFEEFFTDHLPYKNQLTRLNGIMEKKVFQKPVSDDVTIGNDGWLFYTTKKDGAPMEQYFGRDLYTEEKLAQLSSNLLKIRDNFKEQGIEFVIFIAPNKARIYYEYLPPYYGEPEEEYGAKQIVDYLQENTDLRVVYAYDDLMKAKEEYPDTYLYFHADTHWNNAGGYIGSRALLRELGIETKTLGEMTLVEFNDSRRDLASMLNMRDVYTYEVDYTVSGWEKGALVEEKREFFTEYIYHNKGMDERRLFVIRDSYVDAMAVYLGNQFNESYMVHNGYFTWEMLEEWQPDIVVFESVERYIDGIFSFGEEQ